MLRKKENYLVLSMFGLLLIFGCYEFTLIDQPTEANSNSSFDVNIVMKEDADEFNDWTSEAGDLTNSGIFGVLIPEGWTVTDNISVRVESKDSDLNGDGVEVTATSDHSGDYVLVYNETESTKLTDSIGAPAGYVWWGARTETEVDMAFFDSLHFSITVNTDAQTGDFYLQYTVGDFEYWERNPVHYKSAPMQITISPGVGVNELLTEDALNVYPNPSYGNLNVNLKSYQGEEIDMMIYDLKGRQVANQKISNSLTMLDLVDLSPGTYVLRLESESETMTRRFLKY
jgi:hypothetical protein